MKSSQTSVKRSLTEYAHPRRGKSINFPGGRGVLVQVGPKGSIMGQFSQFTGEGSGQDFVWQFSVDSHPELTFLLGYTIRDRQIDADTRKGKPTTTTDMAGIGVMRNGRPVHDQEASQLFKNLFGPMLIRRAGRLVAKAHEGRVTFKGIRVGGASARGIQSMNPRDYRSMELTFESLVRGVL